MRAFLHRSCYLWAVLVLLTPLRARAEESVEPTVTAIVTRLYDSFDLSQLMALDEPTIQKFLTPEQRQVLATGHWCFDVNVPVVVSVFRDQKQAVVPFWLPEAGFQKTVLTARNEKCRYEVWQKPFAAGRVQLGINGFDGHSMHYFVVVAPQQPGARLELSHFAPADQTLSVCREGAFTYHDWTELVLEEVPEALRGQVLLPTTRGRSREAHFIGGFRQTPLPSSPQPDQLLLTWSEDPRTTQTIQWRTSPAVADGVVRYRPKGAEAAEREVPASVLRLEDRMLANDRFCHRFTAVLQQLKPATTYVYQVGSPAQGTWSEPREFTTAPEGDAPFTFLFLGDTHRSPIAGQLLAQAERQQPQAAFVMLGGDLVSTGLHRDDWDQVFQSIGDFTSRRPLVPTLGNHDDQNGLGASMYLDLLALPQKGPAGLEPERAYTLRYGSALLVILDSISPVERQTAWLEEVLSRSDATWKFVMFHFPPYNPETTEVEYPDMIAAWIPLFDRYEVDVVLNGHTHRYARSYPLKAGQRVDAPTRGTVYLDSVAVPNPPVTEPAPAWAAVFQGGQPLFQTFQIHGRRCQLHTCNLEGELVDTAVLEK